MNTAYKLPKNPKIQALINEIVNDETQQKKEVDDVPAKPSAIVCQKERVVEKILPTLTPDIIAEVFEERVLPSLPSEVVAEVFQKKVIESDQKELMELLTELLKILKILLTMFFS